jgi:hypothetical protein
MAMVPPLHVLVVEDDADTRANLCDILEMDGYSVETAGTRAGRARCFFVQTQAQHMRVTAQCQGRGLLSGGVRMRNRPLNDQFSRVNASLRIEAEQSSPESSTPPLADLPSS